MKLNVRRLLIAILAWPAGIVAALLLLFTSSFFSSSECTVHTKAAAELAPMESAECSVELQSGSPTNTILWIALGFGPGIVATRAWWRGRGGAS